MKKPINRTIKAHLIRGAFYLLLLVAVCATPLVQGGVDNVTYYDNVQVSLLPCGSVPCGGGTPTPTPTATPTCPSGAPGGGPVPWSTASPYPFNNARYGFAQTATHLYVFGGVSNGTRVNAVNRYDLATGTWQPRAPMPFTSEAPTCALMEATGIVYCAEGDTGSGFASYDIATDTWASLAAIPGGNHYGSVSGAFNGKVFVAGGTTSFSNAVQVYDVASNTWSAGTAAPNGYLLAGYQQVGQYLYVVGGWTGGAPNGLTTTTRLDMSSAPGVWENGPAFPMGRADFGLAYDAGTNKLYALGGDLCCDGLFFNSTDEVDEVDLSAWPGGTWVTSPPNLPRAEPPGEPGWVLRKRRYLERRRVKQRDLPVPR
jgi:Kelch motif